MERSGLLQTNPRQFIRVRKLSILSTSTISWSKRLKKLGNTRSKTWQNVWPQKIPGDFLNSLKETAKRDKRLIWSTTNLSFQWKCSPLLTLAKLAIFSQMKNQSPQSCLSMSRTICNPVGTINVQTGINTFILLPHSWSLMSSSDLWKELLPLSRNSDHWLLHTLPPLTIYWV